MQFAIVLVVLLIILAEASWHWGVDSTDKFDNAEWRRQQSWFGGPRHHL